MATISDVDDALVEKIKDLAEAHHRSVETEIRHLLQQAVAQRRRSFVENAEAIAALIPTGVTQTDSTILVREDRDGSYSGSMPRLP